MPLIAITREMGTLGKDVATGLGRALGLPVIYHEIIDQLADRMRVRKSHVERLLDGKAGLFERLTADKTSLALHSADEIFGLALQGSGAIIRGWGATHLLRDVPHAVCVRVCSPFELRKRRMMKRLDTDDAEKVAHEIEINDEAHSAIMKRHFDLRWTDSEHYDLVLNTERVDIDACVEEVVRLVRSPLFAETEASHQELEDLALSARVRAALRRAPETRDAKPIITSRAGRVTIAGDLGGTERLLAAVEVVASVPGVRDFDYRLRKPEDGKQPRIH